MRLPYELEKPTILKKQRAKIARGYPKRSAKELFQSGIINLDKPSGPRSLAVQNEVKALLEVSKVGYAGTLDPKVTGVLTIGLGKATKLLTFMSKAGKVYEGEMKIHKEVPKAKLLKAVEHFTGEIEQMPPKISAVKRQLRKRTVYGFKIKKIEGQTVSYKVATEAGTYIRKLVHDLGEYLGVGAHMTKLRRTKSGPYLIKDSITMNKLKSNYQQYLKTKRDKYIQDIILPPESAVQHLPKLWVHDEVINPIKHGSPVYVPGIIQLTSNVEKGRSVAMFDQENNLLGIGVSKMSAEDIIKKDKGNAIKTDTVII